MNPHILKTLIKWNKVSEVKNFSISFRKKNELKSEIKKLQKPANHFSSFFNYTGYFYAGLFIGQTILILARINTLRVSLFSFIFLTIIFILSYIKNHFTLKKANLKIIEKNKETLQAFENLLQSELYNINKFSLMEEDYKSYCYDNDNSKQYAKFKLNLINSNLDDFQILNFYNFMVKYCENNINETSLKNLNTNAANKTNNPIFDYQFFDNSQS